MYGNDKVAPQFKYVNASVLTSRLSSICGNHNGGDTNASTGMPTVTHTDVVIMDICLDLCLLLVGGKQRK